MPNKPLNPSIRLDPLMMNKKQRPEKFNKWEKLFNKWVKKRIKDYFL